MLQVVVLVPPFCALFRTQRPGLRALGAQLSKNVRAVEARLSSQAGCFIGVEDFLVFDTLAVSPTPDDAVLDGTRLGVVPGAVFALLVAVREMIFKKVYPPF